jgi:hypothetical protein
MKNSLRGILFKKAFTILFCSIFGTAVSAQHLMFGSDHGARVEMGLNFGPTFFLGDLGGHAGKGTTFIKDLNLQLTKFMKGGFVTIYPTEWIGLRFAGEYTFVEGRDKIINTNGVDELWRKQRNMDFKSNMWEAYIALEFFPLQYFNRNDEEYDPVIRPYFFGGVGIYHFNPKGSLTDQNGNVTWHELQPLHTEGQGFPEDPGKKNYKLTQLNIPMGGGLKYIVSNKVNLGIELLYRKTFTDYIDDVSTTYIDPNHFFNNLPIADAIIASAISDKTVGYVTPGVGRYEPGTQRGNSKNNDAYFSFLLKLGIRFGNDGYGNGSGGGYGSSGYWNRVRNQSRCPARF